MAKKRRRYQFKSRAEAEDAWQDCAHRSMLRDRTIWALIRGGDLVEWFEKGGWYIGLAWTVMNKRAAEGLVIILDYSATIAYQTVLGVDEWLEGLDKKRRYLLKSEEGADLLSLASQVRKARQKDWRAVQ